MNVTSKPRPVGTLDDYLDRICAQIQLSELQYETAVARYERVGAWLTEQDTTLDRLSPEVAPQGSMLQRTTIRPLRRGENSAPFDLDIVCICDCDPHKKSSQSMYESVRQRLMSNTDFKSRIEEARERFGTSGKCVKLAYVSDDFFLDVVPMCKDPSDPDGIRLLMCNPSTWGGPVNPIETWRPTDPFRFAEWLQNRCDLRLRLMEKVHAGVAPVPAREQAEAKSPLRRAIQILKRERDMTFLGDGCRPTSILLTALAGKHYSGEDSIADTLDTVLQGISHDIQEAFGRKFVVENPVDKCSPHVLQVEDLAAPLDDVAFQKFASMIEDMKSALSKYRSARGVPELYPLLAESFGDAIVKRAFTDVETEVKDASKSNLLGAATSGSQLHIMTSPKVDSGVQPIRANDFHEDDRA